MEKVPLGLAARSLACVSLGVRGHVGPPQLGLDKWFDANVRQTSNYSPNDECSATALPPPSGAGCSGRPQATYCDRPITPGKVPLPRFLGGKKENSSTKMPRCCITYCPKNAIGFVKPWQGAWCFCGLEKSDAGMSSPARSPPPSLREWSRVKSTMANFICSSLRFSSVHL